MLDRSQKVESLVREIVRFYPSSAADAVFNHLGRISHILR